MFSTEVFLSFAFEWCACISAVVASMLFSHRHFESHIHAQTFEHNVNELSLSFNEWEHFF
jgi:hypothetical protein